MSEDTRDEVYAVDEGQANVPRSERILQAFDEVLTSDDFCQKQDNFVDENSKIFTEKGDLPPQCMEIYNKYVDFIENELLSKVLKIFPDFSFDELLPLIQNPGQHSFAHADVLELLSATLDFEEFRALMVSYNKGKDLNLEAVITKFD